MHAGMVRGFGSAALIAVCALAACKSRSAISDEVDDSLLDGGQVEASSGRGGAGGRSSAGVGSGTTGGAGGRAGSIGAGAGAGSGTGGSGGAAPATPQNPFMCPGCAGLCVFGLCLDQLFGGAGTGGMGTAGSAGRGGSGAGTGGTASVPALQGSLRVHERRVREPALSGAALR